MKVVSICLLVLVWTAAAGSWVMSGPVAQTEADMTNAVPADVHPFVLWSGSDGPLVGYRYLATATNAVDAPWVLPARGGGRWLAAPPRAERVVMDGSTNGTVTVYSSMASVVVSTGALSGNLTYVLGTNATPAGGSPGLGRTVRVVRSPSAEDGSYSVAAVAHAATNIISGGGWVEYAWIGREWAVVGSGSPARVANRVVEQDINSTDIPMSVEGSAITHYFFTGSATNTGPQTYHLPTNNVPDGALLSVTVVGTNSHPSQPILYDFVGSGITNRLYDSNRVDFVWSGSTWRRKPAFDQTFPQNGYVYGMRNGIAWEIPIQSDAPSDGLEYVRKLNAWAVASGGGGGGGTNHNALSGLQGGAPGEYYHLTSAQSADLTDAGDSALHFHSADRDRSGHTGTQLIATISDWVTNVWSKITSVLQRGNGVHFATNTGANTLTISGWYLPGANVTFTTNSDGSITISGAAGGGSTNGTPLAVNGGGILSLANLLDTVYAKWAAAGSNITLTITNLPQAAISNLVSDLAAKQAANTNLLQLATIAGSPGDILYRASNGVLTNLGAGSTGQALIITNGAPRWMDLPSVGGGGTTAEVMRRVGWVKFDLYTDGGTDPGQTAWSNYVQSVQFGGAVTNVYLLGATNLANGRNRGGIDVRVNVAMSGLTDTNWIVLSQPVTRISTNDALGLTYVDILGESIVTTNLPLVVGSDPNVSFSLGASNTPNFHRWTNSYYITLYDFVSVNM